MELSAHTQLEKLFSSAAQPTDQVEESVLVVVVVVGFGGTVFGSPMYVHP